MRPQHGRRMGVAEILVALVLLFFLVVFLAPMVFSDGSMERGQMMQGLSNMRQLQILTQQMAEDGVMGWPGDGGGSYSEWAQALLEGRYLSTNDLSKLLSGPKRLVRPGQFTNMDESAVLVYAVSRESPGTTIFLSTANFTNTPDGGVMNVKAKPFQAKGFAILGKEGSGQILVAQRSNAGGSEVTFLGTGYVTWPRSRPPETNVDLYQTKKFVPLCK